MSTPENDPRAKTVDSELNEILRHYMAGIDGQVQQATKLLRDEILPAFLPYGVANIEAAYSGYGDSGAIDGVQYRDKSGLRVERNAIPGTLTEKLENCIYEFLPAGFEINDGGQGTLMIDTQTAKVTIQHQENYTETRDSTREYDL
jgi:hypothetical protein